MFTPYKLIKRTNKGTVQTLFEQIINRHEGSLDECSEDSLNMNPIAGDYKYQTLDISLKPRILACSNVAFQCRGGNDSEQMATTNLLSESQKGEQKYQNYSRKVHSLQKAHKNLKTAQDNSQRITPFQEGEQISLQRHLLNRRQDKKGIPTKQAPSTHRYLSIPTRLRKDLSQGKEGQQQNNVKIVAFDSHLLSQENCFHGVKRRDILGQSKRQRLSKNGIRKSISMSLCQIAQKQDSSRNSVNVVIKKLAPLGKVRSNSLPIKVDDKVGGYVNAMSKIVKIGHNKDIRRSILSKKESPFRTQQEGKSTSQNKEERQQINKFSMSNLGSIFRKLNAFKRKYTVFQTSIEDDLISQQKKLQISYSIKRKTPIQFSNKLTEMRCKLMKTGLKLRRTSSFTNNPVGSQQ